VSETETGLSPSRLRVVNLLAGAESDGADVAGCKPEAVAEWLRDDPEFIAGVNRAKSFQRERLRADVLSLASDAMATLRELVSGADVPPSIRRPGHPRDRRSGRRLEDRRNRPDVGGGS